MLVSFYPYLDECVPTYIICTMSWPYIVLVAIHQFINNKHSSSSHLLLSRSTLLRALWSAMGIYIVHNQSAAQPKSEVLCRRMFRSLSQWLYMVCGNTKCSSYLTQFLYYMHWPSDIVCFGWTRFGMCIVLHNVVNVHGCNDGTLCYSHNTTDYPQFVEWCFIHVVVVNVFRYMFVFVLCMRWWSYIVLVLFIGLCMTYTVVNNLCFANEHCVDDMFVTMTLCLFVESKYGATSI